MGRHVPWDRRAFKNIGRSILIGLMLVFPALSVPANAGVKADENGIIWKSESGAGRLRLGGRLQYDFVVFDPDVTPLADNNDLRRFSLYLSGRFATDWTFRISGDLSERSRGWTGVWLRYGGLKNTTITLGNMMAPLSLEDQIASNISKFVERSLPNIFTLGLESGIFVSHFFGKGTVSAAIVSDPIDVYEEKTNRAKIGGVGRATWAPIRKRKRVLHFGVSAAYFWVDPGSKYKYNPRPEVGITSTRLVDTGNIEDVNISKMVGVEAAWMAGPLLVQAEYLTDLTTRYEKSDLRFWGAYVQAAYVLTGERQGYIRKRGSFKRIKPKRGGGALELAGRWSIIDLDSRDVEGGIQKNITVGLNWYFKKHFRLSANYIRMLVSRVEPRPDESPSAFLCRFQVVY